jgi:Arc/MetJ-type ribon-helix-helix transcriptional regulator
MVDMKENVSLSLEKALIVWMDDQVKTGKYRNRSHVAELAINDLKKKGV